MEKPSSLRPNYVTLKQLQELRLREKQRQEEEEEERRREEEDKLRGVKAEEEEQEQVGAFRGEPSKHRKPSNRNRRGNGSRRRNAAPKEEDAEVEQVAKRDAMGAASEISKPGEDDGKDEGAVGVVGDVIDAKDSNKKKYSRTKENKGKSGTGWDGSNVDVPRGRAEKLPVRAPGGELARPAEISRHFGEELVEISQHFGKEAENGPEKIEPSRNQTGGKGENQQSGSTPERSVTAGKVEHQRRIGGDGEKVMEWRRRMGGRGGGWFSRGGKRATGAGQGLVWVRKDCLLRGSNGVV